MSQIFPDVFERLSEKPKQKRISLNVFWKQASENAFFTVRDRSFEEISAKSLLEHKNVIFVRVFPKDVERRSKDMAERCDFWPVFSLKLHVWKEIIKI